VGKALREIRDKRLYKPEYGTFERYCRERWNGMSRRTAYDYIKAASVRMSAQSRLSLSKLVLFSRLTPDQQTTVSNAVDVNKVSLRVLRLSAHHAKSGRSPEHIRKVLEIDNEKLTPDHIINCVVKVLGVIDVDPCSNKGMPNIPARIHYTASDNGLKRQWAGTVFLNPPYSNGVISQWIPKAVQEYESGRVSEMILLIPSYATDVKWFHELSGFDVMCYIKGRLKFKRSRVQAPFANTLVYFGRRGKTFYRACSHLGICVIPADLLY